MSALVGLTEKTDLETNMMIKCAEGTGDLESSEGTFGSGAQLSPPRPGRAFWRNNTYATT